ncbi:MAG: acyl-CoA dehydrogenase family protein [Spirochaetes bacterium]|nr:acyl-CoA dehydrogenase family protein [Spirochaetota bacterium]
MAKNTSYSFDEYLQWRNNIDYYADDLFLQKVTRYFSKDDFETVDIRTRELSRLASYRWRDIADEIAQPHNRIFMQHYDGHNHRIDRIIRPTALEEMEKEVFGQGIFSSKTLPWERLVKQILIYQNGEAGIACPLVCTEGLVALLEQYHDHPELEKILVHCKEGINGNFGIGAQYLSEIQGGSDVAANDVEAVENGDHWLLYGKKFFCSATHADYVVITARPKGSEHVGLFVMPSYIDKNLQKRNGYTIDRLKWKLGTAELPTAEITFNGAIAYKVGPIERGIANVVGIVLTHSRLTVGLSAAAAMIRAAREATQYAQFRTAFGFAINQFPLLKRQLEELNHYAKRTLAGAFKIYELFQSLPGGLRGGLITDEDVEIQRKRFCVRILIMLQKIVASWDATDVLRKAISVFGGHGVMEDFSSLPRLFRDMMINELWEGPRNVLLTQIYRDIQRASTWYPVNEFIKDILYNAETSLVNKIAALFSECVQSNFIYPGQDNAKFCLLWENACHDLLHEFQNCALHEVEHAQELTSLRK